VSDAAPAADDVRINHVTRCNEHRPRRRVYENKTKQDDAAAAVSAAVATAVKSNGA